MCMSIEMRENNILKSNQSKLPLNITKATEKYISSPVTSTNVATKGVEEAAGSAPNLFKMSGSIDPINEPHNTIPINEKPTVNAIRR